MLNLCVVQDSWISSPVFQRPATDLAIAHTRDIQLSTDNLIFTDETTCIVPVFLHYYTNNIYIHMIVFYTTIQSNDNSIVTLTLLSNRKGIQPRKTASKPLGLAVNVSGWGIYLKVSLPNLISSHHKFQTTQDAI